MASGSIMTGLATSLEQLPLEVQALSDVGF